MLATRFPQSRDASEIAFRRLGRAAFGAMLFSLIFLMGSVQPLWYDSATPVPEMSPPVAAVTAALNVGLLLLPLLILILLCSGYFVLVHRAMVSMTEEAREAIWVARVWFFAFWASFGVAGLLLLAGGLAGFAGAPESVRLGLYLPFAVMPTAVLVALLLFLGNTVWALLPERPGRLLRRLVWAEVFFASVSAVGTAMLTALQWRQIEASGVLSPAYSPWTTIPSGVGLVATMIALYLSFRSVRRKLRLRASGPSLAPSPTVGGEGST